MTDIPYLLRGIDKLSTPSSLLISSSKYLNNPRMRDWVATELLRCNGPDVPTPSGAHHLNTIFKEIQNPDEINAMFAKERARWPELDRWFRAGYLPTYTREDLAKYKPGTVGGIFYKHLTDNNYQVDIVQRWEPRNDWEYWALRGVMNHDLEHILGGGGFNSIGELVPGLLKMTYIYKFFAPELACELAAKQWFLSFRFISRMALHYPHCWHAMWDAIERGRKVGESSDAFFLAKYEDYFDLPVEEARQALGIRNATDGAWPDLSRYWDGLAPPPVEHDYQFRRVMADALS